MLAADAVTLKAISETLVDTPGTRGLNNNPRRTRRRQHEFPQKKLTKRMATKGGSSSENQESKIIIT
jgi:hypothetical protein